MTCDRVPAGGERVAYAELAMVVGFVAGWGALTQIASHATDEHA